MSTLLGTQSIALIIVCLAGAALHVYAKHFLRPFVSGAAKVVASISFVALADVSGACDITYGRLILAALILSLIGDVLLLSRQSSVFIFGIAAFLFAHVVFAAAFWREGIDRNWLIAALGISAVAGIFLLRWLWPHLEGFYRIAVPVYLAAIIAMTSLAIGMSIRSMPAFVGVGAAMFAVSDVFVARDRFIKPSFVNQLWGIPLYYLAQVLLALSVTAAGR
ncbi:MAG: lysoplasmalogenase [Acidobacteriota bacterium]